MNILIVDDDQDTRRLLEKRIQALGHQVETAEDGEEAWGKISNFQFQLILTDWLMPKVDGLELCKRIRSAQFPHYTYLILGTSKNTKQDLVEGLDAGADDFIPKPYNKYELQAKLTVGARIISLETTLDKQKKQLQLALSKIEEDLEKASSVQRGLLPKENVSIPKLDCKWLFRPCDFTGGDTLHVNQIDEHEVALYMVDVAGHGLAAAMQTMAIQKFLAPSSRDNRPLLNSFHLSSSISPAAIARELNIIFSNEDDTSPYFTMVYGIIDWRSQELRFTQAGHPHPILISQSGEAQLLGDGGFAVGMFEEAVYEDVTVSLNKGDRLYFYSDGITECENSSEEQFGEERLIRVLQTHHHQPLENLIHALESELMDWNNHKSFDDDVSLLSIEIKE